MNTKYKNTERIKKETEVLADRREKNARKIERNVGKKTFRKRVFRGIKEAIIDLFKYRFIVKKTNHKYISLPLWMGIVIFSILNDFMYSTGVLFFILLLILLSGADLIIEKNKKSNEIIKLSEVEEFSEDEILEMYPEETVEEEEGYSKIEI